MWLLIGFVLCVFTSTVLTLIGMTPGPLSRLDLMVIGAVAALVALSTAFFAVSVSLRRRARR